VTERGELARPAQTVVRSLRAGKGAETPGCCEVITHGTQPASCLRVVLHHLRKECSLPEQRSRERVHGRETETLLCRYLPSKGCSAVGTRARQSVADCRLLSPAAVGVGCCIGHWAQCCSAAVLRRAECGDGHRHRELSLVSLPGCSTDGETTQLPRQAQQRHKGTPRSLARRQHRATPPCAMAGPKPVLMPEMPPRGLVE
jgi:hypothetical protein